jgi:hypothetical protein
MFVVVGDALGREGVRMSGLPRFPDNTEGHADGLWQRRLATASETVDSIIGYTNALGACLKGLLSNVRQLEEVSRDLQGTISGLPAGEARRHLEQQQTLIKERLAVARKLLTGIP